MFLAEIDDVSMPLSDENQKWVKEQISIALYPNGFKKVANWLRYWGLIAASITVCLGLMSIVVALGMALINRRDADARFQTNSETFQTNAQKRMDGIETQLVSLRALIVGSNPARTQNQDQAKDLIQQARQKTIPPIPESVVEQAGDSFIEAAPNTPKAWDVALDFVSYRSFLNVPQTSRHIIRTLLPNSRRVVHGGGDEWVEVKDYTEGLVLDPRQGENIAALGDETGKPATEYVNMIFNNCHIIYHGGPIKLVNVIFQNCTFDFTYGPDGQDLARNILAKEVVNFRKA